MTSKKTARDFALWTSASGVPHIGRAQSRCMRVFWLVVFLACLVMFGYQMYLLVENYLQYNVIVNTKLEFTSLPFPAVTICNLNPYKQSEVIKVPVLQDLLKGYGQAVNRTLYGTDDKWNFTSLNDTMAIQARARDHMMYYVAHMSEELKGNISYRQEDFVMGCLYDSSKSCMNDFTTIMDPTYGRCFQFNGDGDYSAARAGPRYGMRVLLMTDLTEYLDITESAGVRVTVTSTNEKVYADAFGYNAAAGFTTSFGLQYVETSRLGQPYGNCTDQSPLIYSVEGCFRGCLQDYLIKSCQCCDPAIPCKEPNHFCDNSQLSCITGATGSDSNNASSTFNAADSCICPELCSEHSYSMTVSTGNWPSKSFLPSFCTEFSGAKNDLAAAHAWCAQNTMMVEIYYERMNYQSLSETAAYAMESLISDFGGQIGLWIGVSVITVVEFLFFPILLLSACCCGKGTIMHAEYDEEDNEFDKILRGSARTSPVPIHPLDGDKTHSLNKGSVPQQIGKQGSWVKEPYVTTNHNADLPPGVTY